MTEYEWPDELDTDERKFYVRYFADGQFYKDEDWGSPRPFAEGMELEHFASRFVIVSVTINPDSQVVHLKRIGPATNKSFPYPSTG